MSVVQVDSPIPKLSTDKIMSVEQSKNFLKTAAEHRRFIHRPGRSKKDLEFLNLKYFVFGGDGYSNPEHTVILKSLSGKFLSGNLTAIMGPSGAGKSTLMDILAGFKTKNVTGTILVNGKERVLSQFRKLSCYIMQNDDLHPYLTTEEALSCSAVLKLDENMKKDKRNEVVNEILEILGLSEVRHTRVLHLSGGQKKRLSIAQELVSNPPVMFFDEPTSGLDSSSCFQCISLLQCLARGGRTIICTIHQPSAKLFEMFDQLYFMADGNCIYRGPVCHFLPYLPTQGLYCPSYHNPADFFMEVACGEHGDYNQRLSQAVRNGILDETLEKLDQLRTFQTDKMLHRQDTMEGSSSVTETTASPSDFTPGKASQTKEELEEEAENDSYLEPSASNEADTMPFSTSSVTQFCVLFVRSLKSMWRDPTLTALRLFSHMGFALLMGLLYFNAGNDGTRVINNAAFVFFCVNFLIFCSIMPTILTFPQEISTFKREHLNCWYSIRSYYLAKTFADVPFQIAFPTVYATITYWMTGQPPEMYRFLMFTLMCVMTALVGTSLGLLIGAATSMELAVFLGPITALPTILFTGFFITFDTIPKYLQWFSYICFARYTFEGQLQALYGYDRPPLECPPKEKAMSAAGTLTRCISQPTMVLDIFSCRDANFAVDFLVLCAIFVTLRVICYFVLRWRVKSRY